MALVHQKATAITNRDATPSLRATTGHQASGNLKSISATIVPTDAADIDSTIQLVRVPSKAIVKSVDFWGADQGSTGTFDLGVYYATDGSNALSVPGGLLAAAAIDQDFFGTAFVSDGTGGFMAFIRPGRGLVVEVATPRIIAPAWSATDGDVELWEALGLSSDPGGNFDIVATLLTEAVQTGAAIGIKVDYIA